MLIKYTNLDIPAKLFFDMVYGGNYSAMGEGTPKQLESAFDILFDEYVTLDDNKDIRQLLQKNKRISDLQFSINALENHIFTLANMYMLMSEEQVKRTVDILNKYTEIKRKFDLNKDFLNEVLRMQNIVKALGNELNQLTDGIPKIKEKIKYSFEENLVNIGLSLEMYIPDDNMTTYKFRALKKADIKRHELIKKATNGKK